MRCSYVKFDRQVLCNLFGYLKPIRLVSAKEGKNIKLLKYREFIKYGHIYRILSILLWLAVFYSICRSPSLIVAKPSMWKNFEKYIFIFSLGAIQRTGNLFWPTPSPIYDVGPPSRFLTLRRQFYNPKYSVERRTQSIRTTLPTYSPGQLDIAVHRRRKYERTPFYLWHWHCKYWTNKNTWSITSRKAGGEFSSSGLRW